MAKTRIGNPVDEETDKPNPFQQDKKTRNNDQNPPMIPFAPLSQSTSRRESFLEPEKKEETKEELADFNRSNLTKKRTMPQDNVEPSPRENHISNMGNVESWIKIVDQYFTKYGNKYQNEDKVRTENAPLIFPSQQEADDFLTSRASENETFLIRKMNEKGEQQGFYMSCGNGTLYSARTLEDLKTQVDLHANNPNLPPASRKILEAESIRLNEMINPKDPVTTQTGHLQPQINSSKSNDGLEMEKQPQRINENKPFNSYNNLKTTDQDFLENMAVDQKENFVARLDDGETSKYAFSCGTGQLFEAKTPEGLKTRVMAAQLNEVGNKNQNNFQNGLNYLDNYIEEQKLSKNQESFPTTKPDIDFNF